MARCLRHFRRRTFHGLGVLLGHCLCCLRVHGELELLAPCLRFLGLVEGVLVLRELRALEEGLAPTLLSGSAKGPG